MNSFVGSSNSSESYLSVPTSKEEKSNSKKPHLSVRKYVSPFERPAPFLLIKKLKFLNFESSTHPKFMSPYPTSKLSQSSDPEKIKVL